MGHTWRTTMPVQDLIELFEPFDVDVWGVGGVSPDDVALALDEGRLWQSNYRVRDLGVWTAENHAARIAWLVTHGWDANEPLWLEVHPNGEISLEDGNHRLHALAYTGGDVDVLVEVFALALELIEEAFDVCLEEANG